MSEQKYADRQAASRATALRIAAALQQQLRSQPVATAVISGGATPAACYRVLSAMPLDWAKVRLVPSDERWVPTDDENSNDYMLRSTLLRGRAASAVLVSLYRAGMSVADACEAVGKTLEKLPWPMAVSLVGMGEDGHFASLFPDSTCVDTALDMETERWVVPVKTAASAMERISLTMGALTRTSEVLVLIFGEKKRQILAAAYAGCEKYPITALLQQNRVPVRVIWAP